jgi:hypothetical protein
MPTRLICLCLLLAAGVPVRGGEPGAAGGKKAFVAEAWAAVSDDNLEALRGGFEINTGLSVSFGFVRSVSINGDLVSQTRFTLPDLSHITEDQAKAVSAALAGANIVQNGTGNSVGTNNTTPINLPPITVVQNSLDNQSIQTMTVVNAGVNSLGILKSINTQSVLRDALLSAVGTR